MAFIFLFVDGVGLGENDEYNPLVNNGGYSSFHYMTKNQSFDRNFNEIKDNQHLFKGIDACLGVDGLPQSGTGQATLFSGINASKIVGRHFGPYPHSKTKYLLQEESLFIKLQEIGKSCYFMNAFPKIFFDHAKKRNRWSCCTLMTRSAGISLNSVEEVKRGKAITAGINQEAWRDKLHIDVPRISIPEAADRVIEMAKVKDFILVEYYLTDKAGHAQEMEYAVTVLNRLNTFISSILEKKNNTDTLLMTSDHGNIENLSVRTHTFNKVPLFVDGPLAEQYSDVRSIQDVPKLTVKAL